MTASRASRRAALKRVLILSLITLVWGCGEGPGTPFEPPARVATSSGPSGPQFLRFDAAAPPLVSPDTSFVAVAGERIKFRILFAGSDGSDRFLELGLHNESLFRYPPSHPRAGERFVAGDEITITVKVDPETLAVTFGPAGLQFDPQEPAELELGYLFADPDFNGDGAPDPQLEPWIRMFRQAAPGDPWVPLNSKIDLFEKRVKSDLTGFSRYALAI